MEINENKLVNLKQFRGKKLVLYSVIGAVITSQGRGALLPR